MSTRGIWGASNILCLDLGANYMYVFSDNVSNYMLFTYKQVIPIEMFTDTRLWYRFLSSLDIDQYRALYIQGAPAWGCKGTEPLYRCAWGYSVVNSNEEHFHTHYSENFIFIMSFICTTISKGNEIIISVLQKRSLLDLPKVALDSDLTSLSVWLQNLTS